jgi:hypothetical protein
VMRSLIVFSDPEVRIQKSESRIED